MSDRRLLDEGVARGIITGAQRDALLEIRDLETSGPEGQPGFTGVNVAYGLGALLVLFASGWFLISQWESLGGGGVLAVAAAYLIALWYGGSVLERRGYPRAGQIAVVLAISLIPVVAWGVMRVTGLWPALDVGDPRWGSRGFRTPRYLVLELATLAAAAVHWHRRRLPLLMVPIAISAWWAWFHLARFVQLGGPSARFDEWVMLAAGLALLAAADTLDRWQRRTNQAGDHARPMWIVAAVAFAFGFLAMWADVRSIRHLLLPVAAAFIAMSLRTRRIVLLVVGVLGVFGYLAWLAEDVFKRGAAFPAILAGLGIAMIATAVWLQKRFPELARRVGGEDGLPLPWPLALSWVPAGVCAVLAWTTRVGKP